MGDYVPSIGMARARYCDSIVRKDGVPHSFVVTHEEHAKNHAEFDRMIAEVERAAAEKALTDAAGAVLVSDWWAEDVTNSSGNVCETVREWLRARAAEYRKAVRND